MTDPNAKEHLDQLVKSPGWLLFKEFVRRTYGGDAYGRAMKLAIEQAKESGGSLEFAVRCVDAQSDTANVLVSWPDDELRKIAQAQEEAKQPTAMGRGGY